jgi:hypothetical protein
MQPSVGWSKAPRGILKPNGSKLSKERQPKAKIGAWKERLADCTTFDRDAREKSALERFVPEFK